MKAGESIRFDCESCNKEFEVCYEPKARDNPKAGKGITPAVVEYCPFCASAAVVPQSYGAEGE